MLAAWTDEGGDDDRDVKLALVQAGSINGAVVKALAVPEVRKHYTDNGLIPVGNSPEEFADFLAKDIALQASIAKRIGIQPQ